MYVKSAEDARCSCGLASVSVLAYVSRANPKMERKECEKFLFGCEALTSKNDFFIFRILFLRDF